MVAFYLYLVLYVCFVCIVLCYKVIEVGVRKPGAYEMERLGTGEVGYMVCGVKNVLDARVGDTITSAKERETISARRSFSGKSCGTL